MNGGLIKRSLHKRPTAAITSAGKVDSATITVAAPRNFKRLMTTIGCLLFIAPCKAQVIDDPFAPQDKPAFEVKLKKLIYIEVKFDSIPKSLKANTTPSEITLPHCAELSFDHSFSMLTFDYKYKLDFDSSGAITNTFIVLDYRGGGKTFSNGGDNILVKVIGDNQSAKIHAAFNKTAILYSIAAELDTFRTIRRGYKVLSSTITETHEGKILHDLRIRLQKPCCCD